jgi:hypothetical protein
LAPLVVKNQEKYPIWYIYHILLIIPLLRVWLVTFYIHTKYARTDLSGIFGAFVWSKIKKSKRSMHLFVKYLNNYAL